MAAVDLLVLEREDDLDGSAVEAAHAAAEAHKLVQVGDPLGAGLRVLLRYDDTLAARERIVDVLRQLVLAAHQVRRRWMICVRQRACVFEILLTSSVSIENMVQRAQAAIQQYCNIALSLVELRNYDQRNSSQGKGGGRLHSLSLCSLVVAWLGQRLTTSCTCSGFM